jgi:hypothetical protein
VKRIPPECSGLAGSPGEDPIITDAAHADLDEMWDHIAQRGPTGADRLIDRFYASAGIASRFLSN